MDGKISSFFYSNHFLEEIVLSLFRLGCHQVLYEPHFRGFLCWLLEETWAMCPEHKPCAGVICSCLAAVLLGRVDQVVSIPKGKCAFYSALGARPRGGS